MPHSSAASWQTAAMPRQQGTSMRRTVTEAGRASVNNATRRARISWLSSNFGQAINTTFPDAISQNRADAGAEQSAASRISAPLRNGADGGTRRSLTGHVCLLSPTGPAALLSCRFRGANSCTVAPEHPQPSVPCETLHGDFQCIKSYFCN